MKIAVVGKGGVGKTTLAGTLARVFAQNGFKVIAVDADPSLNLASTLGVPRAVKSQITPISEDLDLVKERVGTSFGGFLNFTPKVDDIVEKYGLLCPDGVTLLVMGTVRAGDSGCLCPENAFLKALLSHLVLGRLDLVILDMVAGLEHFGRGTAKGVDVMLCVVEPGVKSVDTAERVVKLAKQIGVAEVLVIGNKVSNSEEEAFIENYARTTGMKVLGHIPFDTAVIQADMNGVSPLDYSPHGRAVEAIKNVAELLRQRVSNSPSAT